LYKRIKNLTIALVFALTTNSAVFAQPSLNNSNRQSQFQSIEGNIENLDNQIGDILHKIDDNKNQIDKTQKNMKVAENELKISQDNIKKEQDLYNLRIRAIYINGSDGYLNVLLDSKGLGDFISRIDMVKKIVEFDNKIIISYKTKQSEVINKRDKLTLENKRLLALKSDNEKKLTQLNSDKDKQKKLIAQSSSQLRMYASAEQAAVSGAVRQVSNIRNSAPKLSLSRGGSAISGNNVIAYASNYLGTPYVWGGTAPNPGFDCSGFTQYVYSHFGVPIGRTTYDQINDGVGVSRDQLQPGDLVFFGSKGNPTHVGVYVGDGAYIHSPRTGDVIKVSSVDRSDFISGRRVK